MRTNNKFTDIENLRSAKNILDKAIVAGILAGSLAVSMLFLGSCANMKSMEQIYPQSVVQMLEENGYTSQDYDAKKQEFLNADPGNLDCGLQIVPHNYYKERFGLTDQEISEKVLGGGVYFIDGSLYLAAQYVPSFVELGIATENEDWNKNKKVLRNFVNGNSPLVINTLFKFDLNREVYQALKSAYSSIDRVSNKETVDKDTYYYVDGAINLDPNKKMVREDRKNNFQYRYLLNSVLNEYSPKVVGEEACPGSSELWYETKGKVDHKPYGHSMVSSFSYVEDGYLYGYFVGYYTDDAKKERYLFKTNVKLTEEDMELLYDNAVLGVPYGGAFILGKAKKNGVAGYDLEIGKCENNITEENIFGVNGVALQDYYSHNGLPEGLNSEYYFRLK